MEQRSFAQDFFFELMRDSQRVRAVHLAERERWIRTLEISGREEVLFELEMLLRGIDCFFNLRICCCFCPRYNIDEISRMFLELSLQFAGRFFLGGNMNDASLPNRHLD